MNNELTRTWKEPSYLCDVCLEILKKTTVDVTQDAQAAGIGLSPGGAEYAAGVAATGRRRSLGPSACCFLNKSASFSVDKRSQIY
jgi:hypothetical protein